MTGQQGGTAIKLDGSNINPVALNLLNFKLPDGAFLIPTPQTLLTPKKPFAQQGFSVFTDPCHFSEDQFSTMLITIARGRTIKSRPRFFRPQMRVRSSHFPAMALIQRATFLVFPSPSDSSFRVFSLSHTQSVHR